MNCVPICLGNLIIKLLRKHFKLFIRRSAVFPVKESEDESDDFVVIEAIEPVELSNKVETTKYDILPLPQDLLEGKQVFSFISNVNIPLLKKC